jgi:hypothetical protein
LFEELLVTGNLHGVRKSSGCDDYATGWKNLLIMQTAYLQHLSVSQREVSRPGHPHRIG